MVNGIKKLSQACSLEFQANKGVLKIHEPYWRIPDPVSSGDSYEDCRDQLAEKLELAVKHRMTAAVDVGVLLSGGLDSSLITALANQHHPDLHTFSIGFESTDEEKGDEFEYSDVIVDYFRTTHTQIPIEKSRMLSALPKAVASMAEPMGSHDAIGFYLLSQEVSRSIKVVQSGQGADEIFAGYHWYPKIDGSALSAKDAYEQAFFDRDVESMNNLLAGQYQLPNNPSREFLDNWFDQLGNARAVDKALHIDSGVMLVDDPVKRVDNMTMAWGLEARVPFLDHELVEYAFTIPAEYKFQDGGKKILKDVARKYIPSDVIDRPKGYFPVPALKYIRGDYLEMIRSAVDSQRARERGVVSRKALNDMLRAPDDCITRLRGNTLWQYAVLEMWLQSNNL
jgi:asparagine synthase (glutamine-hydrolysing)